MQVSRGMRFAVLCGAVALCSSFVLAGQLVSTMGNVSAVMSNRGFYLTPAPDASGQRYPGDLAPTQAFELVRPKGEKITIGRINTSCVCVELNTSKRTYERGERAIFELRNVRATPPNGQNYAIYVQLTGPIRTTLRFDTFVRSDFGNSAVSGSSLPEPVVIETPAKQAPSAPSRPSVRRSAPPQPVAAKEPETPSEPTSRYHPYIEMDGIELIIPRWEPEVDGKGAGQTAAPAAKAVETEKPAEKAEPAAPAVTYSKEITADAAAEAPVGYSKELKVDEDAPVTYGKEIKTGETAPEAPITYSKELQPEDDAAVTYGKEIKTEEAAPDAPVTYSKEIMPDAESAPENKLPLTFKELEIAEEILAESSTAPAEAGNAPVDDDPVGEFEEIPSEQVEAIVDNTVSNDKAENDDATE